MDVFTLIKDNKETFEDFRKFLFNKLDKNTDKFRSFGKYPTRYKLPYLLQYLESKEVNILEVLPFYNCNSSNQATNFEELLIYVVVEEFKRIELKKTYTYVPF